MRTQRCFALVAAAVLLAALPAAADVYTVKLKNGNEFETLYRPRFADESKQRLLISTDIGNWIALPMDAVEEITSSLEARGFGRVINTTTIMLGFAPNDAAVPGEGGGEPADPASRLLDYLIQRDSQQPPPFSVQQFVEPNSVGGLPTGLTGQTPPMSGGTAIVEPPVAGDGN